MANAVRGRSNTSDTSSNDGNLGSTKASAGLGRSGREYLIGEPLPYLEDEEEGVEEGILYTRFGRHRGE